MILRKLLVATSIVAISAGAANALDVSTGATPVTPALELQLPGTPAFTGTTTATLMTETGNFPAGNNISIVLTLPTGVVFNAPVSGSNVTVPGGGTGASAVVQSGGATGDGSVTFLVSIGDSASIDELDFAFDYRLNSCVPAGSELVITANIDGSNTPIEEGTASDDSVIAPCASALNGEVRSDTSNPAVTAQDGDTVVTLASGYTLIGGAGTAGTTTATVGDVAYTIDPAVSIDGTGAPMTDASIDGISFDVVLGDGTGVTDVTVGGVSGTPNAANNTFSFDFAPGVIVDPAAPLPIQVEVNAGVAPADLELILTQNVSVQNAVVDFNDSEADLVASEPGANGGLDTLQREGQTFGVYDWNSGSPSGTISVYRVTGLPAGPTAYTVIMTNAGVANGTYNGIATPNANGEFVVNSLNYGISSLPTYVRGDAEFIFETNNDVDVDRLMARNGIVSAFGDGSNEDSVLGNDPRVDDDN
mgnify:CR=1 FL=1